MKKHIANIITVSRIVLSLPLLFLPLSSAWFYALYLLCGFTDMIDGTVARKTNNASDFGAKLDTISDFVFMVVALIRFSPYLHIPTWLWVWIGIIATIKLGGALLGFVRTGDFLFPHIALNSRSQHSCYCCFIFTHRCPSWRIYSLSASESIIIAAFPDPSPNLC